MSNKIEGIPEGWELVKLGPPKIGEWFVDATGNPQKATIDYNTTHWPIIRKKEKPKKYRPFANAAEFEPFRDRWVKRSYIGGLRNEGCFKPQAYDDQGVFDIGEHFTYYEMFNDGRQFDDGTPFGIEVTE